MHKELLTVEFRYNDKDFKKDEPDSKTKIITIGMFDTLEEAILKGNETLKVLRKSFSIKENEVFKLKHLLGIPNRLVCSRNYTIFAKITKLKFDDINTSIEEVLQAKKRYQNYKERQED